MTADAIRVAALVLADAVQAEARLRFARETTEAEIAASLLGQPNPATGKPHSATSAAEAAKQTTEVLTMRERLLELERVTILARGNYEAARVEAWALVREVA